MTAMLPREILICCDGTDNTLTGGEFDTNVLRLHNHLAAQPAPAGVERVLYYDPGVGSPGTLPPAGPVEGFSRLYHRLLGLAVGRGVYEDIAAAYVFLMRHWRDDKDRIYLFGFSRGAFTARAVAGMVNTFGVVRPEYEGLVPALVHAYFAPSEERGANVAQTGARQIHRLLTRRRGAFEERHSTAEEVRASFAGPGRDNAWVHWIGVWDTVESVGMPGPLSRQNPASRRVQGKRFRHVRQALALDEHRWPYLPRLYDEPADLPPAGQAGDQTFKQRWFPGDHKDVGGGYPPSECGISHASLQWMLAEVGPHLAVGPAVLPAARFMIHDRLHANAYWALLRMTVRDMQPAFLRGTAFVPAQGIPVEGVTWVWEQPRKVRWVFAAILLGLLFLTFSGLCLLEPPARRVGNAGAAIQAAFGFARLQLSTAWLQGFLELGRCPWKPDAQPGWAMFWDLGFIACWGYLVAWVTSWSFTRWVGRRTVRSATSRGLWLGSGPMLAVLGDLVEDLGLWMALAWHWAGSDTIAFAALWLGSLGSLLKILGLAVCLLLVALGLAASAPFTCKRGAM